MTQNDELTKTIRELVKVISERAQPLRENGCAPNVLITTLTEILYELYACIDPDELQRLG